MLCRIPELGVLATAKRVRERFQEQRQESCITGASRARDSTALYGKAATQKPHELAK